MTSISLFFVLKN